MNLQNPISDNSGHSDYFKLAFFGSSSFVLPILADILESENQSLVRIGIKQLEKLLENEKDEENIKFKKVQEVQENLLGNFELDSQELDMQIKPIWWKSEELLQFLEFILEADLELGKNEKNEITDLITGNNLVENGEQSRQDIENPIQQFEEFKQKINKEINKEIVRKDPNQIPLFLKNCPKNDKLILELSKKIKLELVVTQPDRANGKKIIENPISQFAKNHNLQLETPIKINSEIEEIKQKYQLDCAIVASFGQILSSKVLEFPRFGIINWHPSLLPKYRGATPIQTALLQNQKISGLSWIKMTKGMDSGPIWLQIPQVIKKSDTFETFANQTGKLGAETWALPIIANLIEQTMNEL